MKNVIVKSAGRKGKGVFALRNFSKGEIVLRYKRGKILDESESPKTWKGKYVYLDKVGDGKFMIMKPPERYINHSCDTNIYIKNWKFIATKSIRKGQEICVDYSINNDYSGVKFKCYCKSKNCRKTYLSRFFNLPKNFRKSICPILILGSKRNTERN